MKFNDFVLKIADKRRRILYFFTMSPKFKLPSSNFKEMRSKQLGVKFIFLQVQYEAMVSFAKTTSKHIVVSYLPSKISVCFINFKEYLQHVEIQTSFKLLLFSI